MLYGFGKQQGYCAAVVLILLAQQSGHVSRHRLQLFAKRMTELEVIWGCLYVLDGQRESCLWITILWTFALG